MYVDESGDPGLTNSPTKYYVLTGLVIHELRWKPCLDGLISFRRRLKAGFGLRLREEFHAAAMLTRPGGLVRIKRHCRLAMIRTFTAELALMTDLNVINVVVDKVGKGPPYDCFNMAWRALIQRFENTLSNHNFRGPANPDERGTILCDHGTDKKIVALLRQMRRYNPVPSQPGFVQSYRVLPLNYIIEDPSFRDSAHSYFIQAADLAAFLLYQRLAPSAYMKKNSGQNYFAKLMPALCTVASSKDPHGIVWL
jgi:hypothetical protein